jgi:Lar family restriction alleviation protein
MSELLKPCPWCGGGDLRVATWDVQPDNWWSGHVTCTHCDAQGASPGEWLGDEDEARAAAIAAWNTRVSEGGSSGGRVQAAPDGATEPSAAEQRLTAITCSFAQHIDRDGVGWSQMRHDDVCALLGEVERLGRALSRARDVLAAAQEIFADDGYFRRSEDAGEAIALIDAALGGQRDGVL